MNFTWEDPNATAADAAAGPKLPPPPNASKGGAADDAGLAPPPVEAAVPEIAEYSYPLGNASNATANASSTGDAAMRAGLATKNASVAPGVGVDLPPEGAKKAPAPLPAAAVAPNATAAPLAPAPPVAAKTTAAPAAAKTTPAPVAAKTTPAPAAAGTAPAPAAAASTTP